MRFVNLLTLLFIGLKLTNNIDWSWWLVLLPTIIHVVLWITLSVYVEYQKEKILRDPAAYLRKQMGSRVKY